MNDMDRLRLYRAQLVWSGRWMEKDGCAPDYDHRADLMKVAMTPVKLVLSWICVALAMACICLAGAIAWVGGRAAAADKCALAP